MLLEASRGPYFCSSDEVNHRPCISISRMQMHKAQYMFNERIFSALPLLLPIFRNRSWSIIFLNFGHQQGPFGNQASMQNQQRVQLFNYQYVVL